MSLDSTQTVVSLDATVFSATKNNESAQVGIIKIIPEQPDPLDESDNDLTYCPKGNSGKGPLWGRLNPGQASGKKSTTSTQNSNSSHKSPANPHRVANLAHGTSSTKSSQSSSKDKGKGK